MFEFELYPYYRHPASEWVKDPKSVLCITFDPEINLWEDEPHIFRKYKGETTIHIHVSVECYLYNNNKQQQQQQHINKLAFI